MKSGQVAPASGALCRLIRKQVGRRHTEKRGWPFGPSGGLCIQGLPSHADQVVEHDHTVLGGHAQEQLQQGLITHPCTLSKLSSVG